MSKDLSIDEIIEIIKKESKSKKESLNEKEQKEDFKIVSPIADKKDEIEIKDSYELSELLKFHDVDFIKNAYIALLKREADEEGLRRFLEDLRSGRKDKLQILAEIRYSPEGKRVKTKIKGLGKVRFTSKIYKIPVLGYSFRWFTTLLKLPKLVVRMNEFEAYVNAKFLQKEEKERYFLKAFEEIEANIKNLYKKSEDYFGFKEYMIKNFEDILSKNELILQEIDYLKASIEDLKENQRINEEMIDSIMRETYQRIGSFEKSVVSLSEKYQEISEESEKIKRSIQKLKEDSLQDFTEFQNFKDNLISDLKDFKERFYEIDSDYRGFKEYVSSYFAKNSVNKDEFKILSENFYSIKDDYGGFKKFAEDRLNLLDYKLSTKSDKEEISTLLDRLSEYKIYTLDNQKRLSFILEEVRKRLPKTIDREQIENILKEEKHNLDALYILFENRFRGFEEEIKRRLEVYLPLLEKTEGEILDLGCGRGEWLSLLKDRGFKAKGVDLNSAAISLCKEKGLDVVEADALEYLRSLRDESLGAVSGFHIIEHLDFELFIKILDEIVRVLKKGGVVIFETPNPLNIRVGSLDFYLDPSHKNPLHPESTSFFMEARGFVNVEYKLVEHSEFESKLKDIKDYKIEKFKDYISLPRDYALIGYKA